MILRKEERTTQRIEKMRDGEGHVFSTPILSPETIYNKGRLFSHIVLEKDCEIGWHEHHGEGEAYYTALGGRGTYPYTVVLDENGVIVKVFWESLHYEDLQAVVEAQLNA